MSDKKAVIVIDLQKDYLWELVSQLKGLRVLSYMRDWMWYLTFWRRDNGK